MLDRNVSKLYSGPTLTEQPQGARTVRLTEALRNTIRKRILDHRFKAEKDKQIAVRQAFGDAVYNDLYSESDRRKMQRLPSGWLEETDEVRVRFGGTFTHVHFSKRRRIPADCSLSCAKVYPATHEFAKRYEQLRNAEKALQASEKEAWQQIAAALNAVSTLKRLHEVWPETKEFTKDLGSSTRNLPAVPVKVLNKMLNLPA